MDGNTDRLYVSRRQRGSGLAGTEDCTDASIQGIEDFIKKTNYSGQ